MAKCTAPVNGHRSAEAAARCPACSHKSSYYGTSVGSSNYRGSFGGSRSTSGNASGRNKAPWSPAGSTVIYTHAHIRTLEPFRKNIEQQVKVPSKRDVFLCHAWDDRKNGAKELHDCLEFHGVSVWFSEKDVVLGSPLLREIDKGLSNSRVGIVLVTPCFLKRIKGEGIADKELSVLLSRDLLIPIVHDTTYNELRDVSPLLGSRSGLDTSEDSFENIAKKLFELVSLED